MSTYKQLGSRIGALCDKKAVAYGSSFAKAGAFLALLYPEGLRVEQMADALILVRMFDKQMRIATDGDAFGESPYQDIAGYGLLGARMHEERKSGRCGSVRQDAANESKAPSDSAEQSASAPITTSADAKSETNSAPLLTAPQGPIWKNSDAPAAGLSSRAAVVAHVKRLNNLGLCGWSSEVAHELRVGYAVRGIFNFGESSLGSEDEGFFCSGKCGNAAIASFRRLPQ